MGHQPSEVIVAFIDHHRDTYRVEPICAVLPIAPSTYFLGKAQQQDPAKRSAQARRDEALRREIRRVWGDLRPARHRLAALVHHSDDGTQYLSSRDGGALREDGIV